MKRTVFIYQNAYSQTGGIQTFNKYFIDALEELTDEKSIRAELVSIYDKKEDVKTDLHVTFCNQSKLQAFAFILKNACKFDTFIFAHVNLSPLAVLLHVINSQARILFCTHGIEIWKKLPKLTEWIMNRSTVLTVSSFSKAELLNYNPKLPDIRVFPNCIKVKDVIRTLPNPFKENTYNLLSVTRLSDTERLKGIDTIIKSLPYLVKNIPNIHYSVIGKGEDVKRLEALADELHVKQYVDFLGFVESIDAYYQHCDIFTLPSKKEGFGIVYLEAMQYSKPVIACNFGGPTDVIEDGKTGFLCEYDDVVSIAGRAHSLYSNNTISQEMGSLGQEKLMSTFTFAKYKARLHEVLQ